MPRFLTTLKNFTLLFDLDGTLIDSTSAILAGFRHSFGRLGLEYKGDKAVIDLIGYPLDYMFAKLGVEQNAIDDSVNFYKEKYRELYLDETTLKFDAKLALQRASEFAILGVVTTKTTKYSKILLEHLGVAECFDTIIGRDDVVNPKPDPEPIILALSKLNKDKTNAFMIGDTKLDAKAAKNAGITSLGVRYGYGDENELKSHFDHVLDNASGAVEFVRDLAKSR